jgi:SNF2 family DNA or RNA helicase
MKDQEIRKALKRFQETGRMVGTLDAIKESLNLQRASTMIVFDGTWSAAGAYQLTQRIYRQGQTRHCQVIHLVGKVRDKYTVDMLQRQSVKKAFNEAQLVNEFVKQLREGTL